MPVIWAELALHLVELLDQHVAIATVEIVGDRLEGTVDLLEVGRVTPDLDLGEELLDALQELVEGPGRLEAARQVDIASMQNGDVVGRHR